MALRIYEILNKHKVSCRHSGQMEGTGSHMLRYQDGMNNYTYAFAMNTQFVGEDFGHYERNLFEPLYKIINQAKFRTDSPAGL